MRLTIRAEFDRKGTPEPQTVYGIKVDGFDWPADEKSIRARIEEHAPPREGGAPWRLSNYKVVRHWG